MARSKFIRGVLICTFTAGTTALMSFNAWATTNSQGQGVCTTAGYSTLYGACSGNTASASSTVTSSESVAVGVARTLGLISDRIGALAGNKTGYNVTGTGNKGQYSYNIGLDENGKAAGGAEQSWGAWTSGTWSRTIFDKSDDSSYDGDAISGMVGVDYRFTDSFLFGIAAGYETSEIDTPFNDGNEDSDGWTGAAYALFNIDETYSINVVGGYSSLDYEMDRLDPLVGTSIKGSTQADRTFGSLDFNGNWFQDNWSIGARVGTFYAREEKDSFTETGEGSKAVSSDSTTIGRARVGGDIGYAFENVTPYAKATYNYDYNDGGSSDSDSVDYGLGVRFAAGSVSGGIEGTGVALKDDLQNYGVNATLRVEF